MLYIITNCTNGKKVLPKSKHLFRNYDLENVELVTSRWKKSLLDNNKVLEAREMYKGVAWKAVLDSEKEFNKIYETKLLIASAGYGLIDSNKKITSYSITFSKNDLDSISKKFSNDTWWKEINDYDESKFDDMSAIFIYLSKEYTSAMSMYLEKLIERYGEKVFIINISRNSNKKFESYSLNFDRRFNSFESGTIISLGQRCLRWLSKEIVDKNMQLRHDLLQRHIDNFLKQFEVKKNKKVNKLLDNELKDIIKNQIQSRKVNSASKGLKILRENGYSCEQKRFQTLFKKIREEM